ncbi:hypothetical protein [Calorimonas adulescens]|uniref:hypothetical protein n=1 Tax=Calorimonas adulescens TaxID=2606906 RepID=UPI001EF00626|nr:hypothetical protein [Calorimonas adulescens]
MQMIFHVGDTEEYLHKGKDYNFPELPDICPHPDCKSRARLKNMAFIPGAIQMGQDILR